jgi:hypothetical protein
MYIYSFLQIGRQYRKKNLLILQNYIPTVSIWKYDIIIFFVLVHGMVFPSNEIVHDLWYIRVYTYKYGNMYKYTWQYM